MRADWNYAGTFLAIMSLSVGFMYAFDIIEYQGAVIAILIMIVFGLIYIGTQLMGVRDDIYGKK